MIISPVAISPFASRSSEVAPVNTVAPSISGTPEVGQTLTAVNGTYTGSPAPVVTGIWQRNGVDITGETSLTYLQVYGDIGTSLTWHETADNGILPNATSDSNAITTIITIEAFNANYAYLNAWSSENVTDVGTTITALDYKGVHNLANDSAAAEPILDSTGIVFDGVNDRLTKNFTSYLSTKTSGSMTFVAKMTDTTTAKDNHLLFCADVSVAGKYFGASFLNGKFRFYSVGVTTSSIEATAALTLNNTYIISVFSNGTTTKIAINGVVVATTVLSGTNAGQWFNNISANPTDNIVLGGIIYQGGSAYGKQATKYIQTADYISDADIINRQNDLNLIYGIY